MAQRARISTDHGDMLIEFYPDVAPKHVENFLDLAGRGFYDGKIFHRVIPNFMLQGGCPDGSGSGKHPDGKTIPAEFNDKSHVPGAVSAARTSDPNSAGCQFFICHGKHSPHLDGQYSLFGQVIEGLEVVDAIAGVPLGARDRPETPVTMNTVTIEEVQVSDYTCLEVVHAEGVATITISREKALNALNPTTLDELERAIEAASTDDAVAGVILTGAGEKAFVAGADLKHLAEIRQASSGRAEARRGQAVLGSIQACSKPVIACVNGYALGGGLELAIACHWRYATQNAKLGLPEVSLGLIPGYGGTQRLSRLIGRGAALELITTGDPIDAAEALRLRLVNRVFETKDAMLEAARACLGKVAQRGPLGVRLAIEAVDRGLEAKLNTGLEIEADLFGVACASEDAAEGIAAFLEKRKAGFKGR